MNAAARWILIGSFALCGLTAGWSGAMHKVNEYSNPIGHLLVIESVLNYMLAYFIWRDFPRAIK